ncbi:transforming acidic coiled-coil-containing protein 3-like isoform X2 [Bradysia coprophila]|uniref:transforming acidic coiled-coil-containing protein 3-like isoform X2 n=1 Tax=Bradysia coprophila TaxID=38358 RepID=UPI00187DD2E0|nr:transforming acidic coiled-coil-containing protein 3-like isoform X2 [Bradysia coprophila]
MENVESAVPVNLSGRPIERNVLKELNNIEGTIKSPKDSSLADQTVIITNNCLAVGSDKAVNKNLVRVTTPTDVHSTNNTETDAAIHSNSGVDPKQLLETTHVVESASATESSLTKEINAAEPNENMLQYGEKRGNLNETCTIPYTGRQDTTFVSSNTAYNETIIMEPTSSEFYDKMEAKESPAMCTPPRTGLQDATFVSTNTINNQTVVMERKDNFADSQPNQTQKIDQSNANESFSADPLGHTGDAREFSLDSPKINQDEPSTPTDKRLPAVSAEKLFSSRKAPTFSEMFPATSPIPNESNNVPVNKQCDSSFVVDKTYVTSDKCSNKESINTTVVLGGNNDKVPTESEVNGDVLAFDFKAPTLPTAGQSNKRKEDVDNFMVLNSNDFDFLQSRGANSVDPENDPRSSLLLRFDPLTNRRSLLSKPPAPIDEGTDTTSAGSSKHTISCDNPSSNELPSNGFLVQVADAMESDSNSCMNNVRIEKNGDKVISVDELLLTNKKIDTTSVDENIRKKMEEYEATQEILLKRITEKDKAITKASNVLELYEKAIAEALAAKEKLSQNYDKEHEELKTDRDVTFQHLLSLESTFADLHMKFERNVQYTGQLQEKVTSTAEDKAKAEDLLRQQEFRYDKMKSHTMQQFDIANTKLEQQTRTISLDNTKLRAQIKREEIHKNAVAEELSQKKKENEELVKICDELISGQRN